MSINLQIAKAIVSNPAFETKDITGDGVKETFCNWALRLYAEAAYGLNLFNNLTANQIYDLLSSKYMKVNGTSAVDLAKRGAFVVAAQKNTKGSGHVAVVLPLDMVDAGTLKRKVPQCANVGKKNGFMGVNFGFSASVEPEYFVVQQ